MCLTNVSVVVNFFIRYKLLRMNLSLTVPYLDREADQVVFPDRAQEHSGQRAEGDYAFPRQLRQR